ncbi:FG-GAP-like repeat-containing protein [Pelagicoccus sp. SDUM812003]|uniref:FG-GAP-like repeat-containing protein n=1 Tax=Pelagicoccus sp. SDUM812003 TaxID=3041267 RepID=UPI00280FCE4B|nr:FG-GAP-like repeat-containing protein [Pelagicoccus sp. SDUM812003]MDQ8203896.1 FG-GAP-like repeat-containing protein [Pelagicoccus sp. SDUM812003]
MGNSRLSLVVGKARKNTPRISKILILSLLMLPILSGLGLRGQERERKPFVQRSIPQGDTLFTELDAERTGIQTTNRYDDPRMWGDLHSEYNVGAIGSGVAIGDYDSDGRPDVFVVSKLESGRLFRNLGDWRFEDVTEAAGLLDESRVWKQGASWVDVDNDGWLDLYLCRFDAPNQLFMNQGDGTFREEARERGLAVVSASGAGCFADYDRDGWLDVYLQTNIKSAVESIEGERDYLFRNNGDGTFTDVTEAAGISLQPTQGHSATWWDQNEDGWLDIYTANDFAVADFLYRNNGDGTFTNVIDEALPHTPFSAMGSDIGDIDNDGDMDFFVADMAGSDWEFSQRGLTDSRRRMEDEYNDDPHTAVQVHHNILFLNTGTERSLDVAYLAGLEGTDWTWSPRFEDLNCDGRVDLFVTNGMDREHNNLDFIVKKLSAVNVMSRIRITKLMPLLAQRNLAYENLGDMRFEEVGAKWGLDKLGVSFGSALGDLDGDGDLDIVFVNYQQGATVLRNDSQAGRRLAVELRGKDSNQFGIGAKVELKSGSGIQTRRLLGTRGYLSTNEAMAQFALGEGEELEWVRVTWPNGRQQRIEGLETGFRYRIDEPDWSEQEETASSEPQTTLFREASAELGLDVVQREEEREGTVSQALMPRRFNRRGPGIAMGDLDGDGVDEIVIGATSIDGAKIMRREDGVYRELDTGDLGEAPPINDGPPLIFDANADGLNDLLFTGGGAALPAEEPEYEPRLWLNQGGLRFARAPEGYLPSAPLSAGAAVAADFDRDGKLDLFLGGRLYPGYYPEPCFSALMIQGENGFEDATGDWSEDFFELGLVSSALASDVDGDGWLDLLVALEWGQVRCYRNEEGQRFVDVSEEWGYAQAGTGLWTSIAGTDFNGDGRIDYAVGNQGLNTIYQGSEAFPMRLYYGKFSRGSERQLILAFEQEGRYALVASRDQLAAKIPEVKTRFPSNDAFAAASLEDVFGSDALEAAELYQASELRSGVFLSQSAGGYAFSPLPRLAQISPIQGLVAEDFDGDGHEDLAMVMNDFSAIAPMGRFDSGLGLVLLGDGRGGFAEQSISQSGWSVSGDAKSLAVADFDGDAAPDTVVTRNKDRTLAFTNQVSKNMIRVAVRLEGKAGNPSGIGARLILTSQSAPTQMREIRCGGGMSSQSTASAFFALPEGIAGELTVLWSSGERARVDVDPDSGYIVVNE